MATSLTANTLEGGCRHASRCLLSNLTKKATTFAVACEIQISKNPKTYTFYCLVPSNTTNTVTCEPSTVIETVKAVLIFFVAEK